MKLKLITLFIIIIIGIPNILAQYNKINFDKKNSSNLEIIQIDFSEFSTLIYLKYTNNGSGWIQADENFYLQDIQTGNKYGLISTINIPMEDKMHILETENQIHYFILEFEKIPENMTYFDIIEPVENGFSFYNVQIDKNEVVPFIDIEKYISRTPVKEYGYYYQNGDLVSFYNHKGLSIVARLSYSSDYGKYYQVHFLIQNFTGKNVLVNPNLIAAKMERTGNLKHIRTKKKEGVRDAKVVNHEEYMKKVNRSQMWNSIGIALGESFSVMNAGYSTSTTISNSQIYSNSFGFARGYVGSTYGSIYGYSTSHASIYGASTIQSYNGMAAYIAQQNAANNIRNHTINQYQIKQTLSDGYLKMHTVFNENEYVGYVNISYMQNVDWLTVNIPLNNSNYQFTWNFK